MGRYNPKDFFFQKAKKENFAARSVFKLEEIDQKYKIFKPHQIILDLGAAPGSWSQYASQKIGKEGRILGIDLSLVEVKINNGIFIQGDIKEVDFQAKLFEMAWPSSFDVVMSDMAPKTTGIRMTDQARSMELCELALDVAQKYLRKEGHFICKLFHSEDFSILRDKIKKEFKKFEALKPESTRKISKEIFLLGLSKK